MELNVCIFQKLESFLKLRKTQRRMEQTPDLEQSNYMADRTSRMSILMMEFTFSVMAKTLDYVRAFSRFSNIESVREVRQ